MKKVYLETFGCQMNVSDSERAATSLELKGFVLLLACPLMHMFMHGGHGGHGGKQSASSPEPGAAPKTGAQP